MKKVNGLLQTSKHETFSHWLGTPSMDAFFQTVDFESFSSRDATVKKIKEALKIPNARTVGIHGLSGVGKTTLVKEIAREALDVSEADKMFDVVVMANVTRNPDIRKVQGQIADMLGMKLDEESEIARAARIRRRLMNEKGSTLIILDDIWAKLDLNMLGIPLESDYDYGDHQYSNSVTKPVKGSLNKNGKEGSTTAEHCMTKTREEEEEIEEEKETTEDANTVVDQSETEPKENSSAIHMEKSTKLAASTSSSVKKKKSLSNSRGCKVLLISQSKRVLSSQMEGKVESIYFVDVLKEKETEAFFKKMAGVSDEHSEFEKLATQIASKCYGLPMSIVATARALQNQSRSVWEDVHRQLERGKLTGAYEFSTRLSYDLLENEELKFAFLLCARMGPDALVMDLVRYCIGLGFLQGIYTVKEARDRVYTLVGKLKASGLLSDSYSIERFTMQDIVRSAALSIASKENNVFAMSKGKIDEWPDRLERYTAISLHHCHIIEGFPQRINCPRLKVFHIDNNDLHLEIPKNFFKRMKGLRVLILSGIRISPVDSSIESLTELKMLSLEQCMLDNELSDIGKLTKLRVLSFSGSDIEKLPDELKELKKLQIFDISNCSKLREIPPNIISCFISLEELYMRNTFIHWEVKEHTSESKHASLSELMHLDQLTTLDIQIPHAVHLPKNLFFDKLYNYKIVIGDLNAISDIVFKIPEKYETSRFLAIQLKDGFDIHSQRGIKMLFERVEHLFLGDLNGVIDIFYRLNLNGFPYLKHLLVVNNSNIQSLIKPKERPHPEKVFPKLESLYLDNLENLDKVCSCKLSTPSFGKLKVIKINRCSKLQTVFLASLVSHLTLLETIEVSKCDGLKEIVEVETQSNTKDIEVEFPELRSLVLHSLSDKFIGFYPEEPRTTKSLFNEKVCLKL
jgi:Leucine-rich repeat (LRR) protein